MTELPPDARALGRTSLDLTGLDLQGVAMPSADLPDDLPGGGEDAGVVAERERLARQLREARMQLALTQARLTALQNSATMQLGKTFVNAAKRPWPRGAQLPRDLYRMWRDRGAPGKSGGANLATALAAAQLSDLKGTGGRFLSSVTAPGAVALADPALLGAGAEPRRLVIAGALTPLACATLTPDAVVHPLLPHDADILIDGTGADLVLIEAAALLPGSPWAYATDPAATDRGRRLARLIAMARSLGKPVILLRNVPPALLPGLGWVASACDVVSDGDLGVQLARFNPLGASPRRPMEPLYAGERDPREAPAVRALLDQVHVPATGARSWRGLPELYRASGVFITASPLQAREQAACGARVIGPVGGGSDAATVAAELGAARAAAPLAPGEIRPLLRDIFETDATPARLAALVKAAGLPPATVGARQLSVLTILNDPSSAARFATSVLSQRLRPAEVIAGAPPACSRQVRDALAPLRDAGIAVRVTDADGAQASRAAVPGSLAGASPLAWAGPLAALATSPWVAPWPEKAEPEKAEPGTAESGTAGPANLPGTYLLDLACARECGQADAAGYHAQGDHGTGEYEFTQRLVPQEHGEAIVARRELFLPGAPSPDAWGARGLRLITISGGLTAGQTGAQ